jgi:hypothetical protein
MASKRSSRSVIDKRQTRVVALVATLPEASAVPAGESHLALEVRGRKFGYVLDNHHGDGRFALNCKAAPGVNQQLAREHADRFFLPAYVGSQGWLGLWLDLPDVDWDEIERVLLDAWRLVAPKRLVAAFDAGSPGKSGT